MSADRLDEIKARAEAATPGPWSAKEGFTSDPMIEVYCGTVFINPDLDGDPIQPEVRAGAEFIAAAREDVPWLVEQVERLERWKAEAIEVMSGLRELGKALGLGLGVQITGPAALAEVERLTAERDALAAQVARVEALAEQWEAEDGEAATARDLTALNTINRLGSTLRAALADPDGGDRG